MSKVSIGKDGLEVNGEKVLAICGEFHYWRVEPRRWSDILSHLMRGAEMTMVASYIPWSVHEAHRGDFDFTGRTNPRANLRGFLDLVAKHGLYFVARSGPYCYGEIDGGGPTDYANVVEGRSKRFVELSEAWIEAVSKVWRDYSIERGGPLILCQVDNEVLANRERFAEFLQHSYRSIEELNKSWERSYTSFGEAAADDEIYSAKRRSKGERPNYGALGTGNWGSCLDVMEYKTRFFPREYVGALAAMFKKHGTDVPLLANNTFIHIQDWLELQKTVASVGLDHYAYYLIPGDSYYWDYVYVSLNCTTARFPWSPEFQCGSGMMNFGPATSQHQKLVTFFSLAAGMCGMNYYMFVERERWEGYCPVTEDGKVREEWFAHRQMFRVLHEVGWKDLRRQCGIGLAFCQEHYWKFLYEGGGMVQPDDYTIVGSKHYGSLAQEPFWSCSRALIDADIDFDVVDMRNDLAAWPFVLYAAPAFLPASAQEHLLAYVNSGGTLVFLSSPPRKDEKLQDCTALVDGLGIGRGRPRDEQTQVSVGGKELAAHLWESYDEPGVMKRVSASDGSVCATAKKAGRGVVCQVGFSAAKGNGLAELLELLGAPAFVRSGNPHVQTSLHRGEGRAVVIAINRSVERQAARIRILVPLEAAGSERARRGRAEPSRAREMFTRELYTLGSDQTIEITIPAKDVAVLHVSRAEEEVDLDKDKLIQGYFERL